MFEICTYDGTDRQVHDTFFETDPCFSVLERAEDLTGTDHDVENQNFSHDDVISMAIEDLESHGFFVEEIFDEENEF